MASLKECLMGTTFRMWEKSMHSAELPCYLCATPGEVIPVSSAKMAVMMLCPCRGAAEPVKADRGQAPCPAWHQLHAEQMVTPVTTAAAGHQEPPVG